MKLIQQLAVLLGFWLIGEGMSQLIRSVIVIPGAIIGMILLAVSLTLGFLKESQVNEVCDFFLNHISFFFVPASVGLLALTNITGMILLKLLLIAIISTFTTMWVSMFVTNWLVKRKGGSS